MSPLIYGGCIFAERPSIAAPDATIIWCTALDPGTLHVVAEPAFGGAGADTLDPAVLNGWISIATDETGREHAVLSDGRRRIRLDVDAGSLVAGGPVVLRYDVHGLASARASILPLRRFLYFCRYRRLTGHLFGPDRSIPRLITLLRVYDAECAGASQHEIAQVVFGPVVDGEWRRSGDSWRSRVRRLLREARAMAAGGYRRLLRDADQTP